MKNSRITIAGIQLNYLVGDVRGNCEKMLAALTRLEKHPQIDIIVFSELSLTGYPPEDLLLREGTYRRVMQMIERLIRASGESFVVFGAPVKDQERLYNAAIVARNSRHILTYYKQCLPNYGVFDERRYFEPGNKAGVFECSGVKVGVTVCEDVWEPGPVVAARDAGAQLLLNLNASPFHVQKNIERELRVRARVKESGLPMIYVNQVGGQDELLFDGASFAMGSDGHVAVRAATCAEDILQVCYDSSLGKFIIEQKPQDYPEPLDAIYQALVLSVRDYVRKNEFSGAIVGLSGGIDSALTLVIAVDALGAENVQAVMMPSMYTSQMSLDDAKQQAQTLGVDYVLIPIQDAFDATLKSLDPLFSKCSTDATEENIQARLRGIFLMALSNKFGKLVLSTGNKSEMAVGYATLYGDMAGGFAPLKDVAKMQVYALARLRNAIKPVIPERVLQRPPSAELAPNQTDQDSLPAYEILDAIIELVVEQDKTFAEIVDCGFDPNTVEQVMRLVFRNEYKRRQAAPGVKITRRAFGKDRRYPITAGTIKNIFN